MEKRHIRKIVGCLLLIGMLLIIFGDIAFQPAMSTQEQYTALQILPSQPGVELPDGFFLYQALNSRGVQITSIIPEHNSLVVKLNSMEQQNQARKILQAILPFGFIIKACQPQQRDPWVDKLTREQTHFR
jgi:TRAP-type C4-dicarboxylate transport system permease small subunit